MVCSLVEGEKVFCSSNPDRSGRGINRSGLQGVGLSLHDLAAWRGRADRAV
jgi:hypothetical protein